MAPISYPRFTMSPNHGPETGGTEVTFTPIDQDYFYSPMWVTFDSDPPILATVQSSTSATCTAPGHYPEIVDVSVVCGEEEL